jgi:hypothetical protein
LHWVEGNRTGKGRWWVSTLCEVTQ